jgi:hypothetical protein
MKTIDLKKYGPIISSKTIGEEIYDQIKKELEMNIKVVIELGSIRSMATFCAKQIFGKLYLELGSKGFFEKIELKGADNDLKTIIQIGIQHALRDE